MAAEPAITNYERLRAVHLLVAAGMPYDAWLASIDRVVREVRATDGAPNPVDPE